MFFEKWQKPNKLSITLIGTIILLQCLVIAVINNLEVNAKTIEIEKAKAIALELIYQNENTTETVNEIALPEPIQQLLPKIRLISLPHDSDPLSWSRVVVDSHGKAYALERVGSYPPQRKESLSNILYSQGLLGTDSQRVALATVAVTFLTHSQPNLISWTTLEEIRTANDLAKITETVVVENIADNLYKSQISLVGDQGAKIQLTYKFDELGKLINIEEKYEGPYYQ